MNLNGYIKLHRKMMAWQWINHPPTFCLFIHLLMMAAYEPGGQSGMILQPGQVSAGKRELAKRTGLSEQQVLTALAHLKTTGEISVSTVDRKYSVITILNWTKYQVSPSGQPSDPPSHDNPESLMPQGFQSFPFGLPTQQTTQVANQPTKSPSFPPSGQPSDPPSHDNPESLMPQGISKNFICYPPNDQPSNPPTEPPTNPPTIIEKNKKGKKGKKKDIYSDENGWPQFGDFVWMPQKEYDTLVDRFGEPFTTKCIETLGNYKGSSGKKYVSDYRAILNWVVDRVKKDYPLLMKRQPQQQQITTTRNDSEWGDGI